MAISSKPRSSAPVRLRLLERSTCTGVAFDVALSICSGVTFLGAAVLPLFVVKDPIRDAH